ncbi:MAG: patatin-like phospholipase family protein [Acidobacteriota bacterium]|nr:patatin-like phospholipase family protein [Acidobacteriota bacterium]
MTGSHSDPPDELALVLTGGGARAAYQVGLLCCLARRFPDLRIPILTGVSAGAINAAHLANHRGTFAESVGALVKIWTQLTTERIYRVDSRELLTNVLRWTFSIVSGGSSALPRVKGLVDTAPLGELLVEVVRQGGREGGVDDNISSGRLQAFAITATSYATGQSVTWCQGREFEPWRRPNRRSVETSVSVDHVMASAALPLVFPAVFVEGAWHGDGGIRLATPFAPALHLGADRILAISTRHQPPAREPEPEHAETYPAPVQVAGVMMNAVFLDALDQDALTLERINKLVRALPPERRGDLREVDLFVLRPSVDLGKLAADFEPDLPGVLRFLARGLGTRGLVSQDWLSMIMFEPDYLRAMMEIGEQDAEARGDELEAFLRA